MKINALTFLLFCLVMLYVSTSDCIVLEEGSFYGFLMSREPDCAYDNWLSHISEGLVLPGYNAYPPWDRQTNGFGSFCLPDDIQTQQWMQVSSCFVNQEWDILSDLLTDYNLPYDIVRFSDRDTERNYYMLREELNTAYDDNGTVTTEDDESGSFNLGWGLFVFNPAATSPTIIVVPHPNDDYIAIPLAWKAFTALNARYLYINGAGREVMWTNQGNYTNSKTLSDPSRNAAHPMHLTYMQSCNEIRTRLMNSASIIKREFSLQTHSYDTNLHIGYANCQVSAGNGQNCVNLPIRDLSQTMPDMINAAGYVIHPANTIGNNAQVLTTNYWCANNTYHPFIYDDGVNQEVVSNLVDLPGYGLNNQMLYSISGWNDFDVYDPFFHIEMDELPDCYPQNDTTLAWFYGWNSTTQSWNTNTRYNKVIAYYQPWVNALVTSLNTTLNMNDNQAPDTPVLLNGSVWRSNTLRLEWERLHEYDFDTWIIALQRMNYLGNGNYQIVDTLYYSRAQSSYLADQAYTSIYLENIPLGYHYKAWIKAKDKSNRISGNSGHYSFVIYSSPPIVTNLHYNREMSDDSHITINWNPVPGSIPIEGYRIERRVSGAMLWDNLAIIPQSQSQYTDSQFSLLDSLSYEYRIATLGLNSQEFIPIIYCTGFLRVFPAPQMITVRQFPNGDINIQWQEVTQNKSGQPDTPDYYLLLKSPSYSFADPDLQEIVVTSTTQFLDDYTIASPWEFECYYKVIGLAISIDSR